MAMTRESLIEWASHWVPSASPFGEPGQRERFTKALADELKEWRGPVEAALAHPPELVERVAKAIERVLCDEQQFSLSGPELDDVARAALSAIPQPAEVVGPAWRDKPDAEGWWMRLRDGVKGWFLVVQQAGELFPTGYGFTRPRAGDRWFGPVRIPEDKAGA